SIIAASYCSLPKIQGLPRPIPTVFLRNPAANVELSPRSPPAANSPRLSAPHRHLFPRSLAHLQLTRGRVFFPPSSFNLAHSGDPLGVMHTATKPSPGLIRALGPFTATAVVVGTVIGSGVFKKPATIAAEVPNLGWALLVWVLLGVLA